MVLSSTNRSRQWKASLPNGVPAPQIVLASQPISQADIDLVSGSHHFVALAFYARKGSCYVMLSASPSVCPPVQPSVSKIL